MPPRRSSFLVDHGSSTWISLLPNSHFTSMPVSEEKAWEWARGNTSAEAFPIYPHPFTVGMMRDLYAKILNILQDFMPASEVYHYPLFSHLSDDPHVQHYVQDFINKHATWRASRRMLRASLESFAFTRESGNRAIRRGLGHFLSPEIRSDNSLYGFQQVSPWLLSFSLCE